MPRFAKALLIHLASGLAATLAFASLSSTWPDIFGIFVAPLYILPALTGVGGHDVAVFPLGIVSGTFFYGAVSFGILKAWIRFRNRGQINSRTLS
jgi:hypothetical protein